MIRLRLFLYIRGDKQAINRNLTADRISYDHIHAACFSETGEMNRLFYRNLAAGIFGLGVIEKRHLHPQHNVKVLRIIGEGSQTSTISTATYTSAAAMHSGLLCVYSRSGANNACTCPRPPTACAQRQRSGLFFDHVRPYFYFRMLYPYSAHFLMHRDDCFAVIGDRFVRRSPPQSGGVDVSDERPPGEDEWFYGRYGGACTFFFFWGFALREPLDDKHPGLRLQ